MDLDLTALGRAIGQLEAGLTRARADPADELVRDGVIQRFEYTYEMSHRALKRYLDLTEASAGVLDLSSFQNLVRVGADRGLLASSWDVWRGYRAARAATSHTYDAAKAAEIYAIVPDFLVEAKFLLSRLEAGSASL